jgi:hypothetical protein
MPINKAALEKLKAAPFTSQNFIDTMKQMVDIQDMMGASGDTQMVLDYQQRGAKVEPQELIPFITIGLRQPKVVEEVEESE